MTGSYANQFWDTIEGYRMDALKFSAQRDVLLVACKRAINTIAAMDAGLVRDGAAYVTMVQGTLVQLIAAVAAVEGENDQTVQR